MRSKNVKVSNSNVAINILSNVKHFQMLIVKTRGLSGTFYSLLCIKRKHFKSAKKIIKQIFDVQRESSAFRDYFSEILNIYYFNFRVI